MDETKNYGTELVRSGKLQDLRKHLNLSKTAMAGLLNVSPVTYASWERKDNQHLWPQSAQKVARFYDSAEKQLEYLEAEGVPVGSIVPLHLAAAALGVPNELLFHRYRNGELNCLDLGVLGLWVRRSEIPELNVV